MAVSYAGSMFRRRKGPMRQTRVRAKSRSSRALVGLLRSPHVALRDRRNRDNTIPRTLRPPRAVEDDGVERLLVPPAEGRAVQSPRSYDAAQELAGRGEDVHGRTGGDIDPP